MNHSVVLFICVVVSFTPFVDSSVASNIYESFESQWHCFRRLNWTHQIGCASAGDGSNYGVARLVKSSTRDQDVDFIIQSGDSPPYVAVISSSSLNDMDLFEKFKTAGRKRVSGILVLEEDHRSLESFSSDRSCPNVWSSFYANSTEHGHCRSQEWNKPTPTHREGLMFVDFPFPVFLIRNSSQIERIHSKLMEHSGSDSWPKLAIELTSRMTAAQSSETCLRKSRMSSRVYSLYSDIFCDPLGGLNLFHHNLNKSHLDRQRSVVMLAARQDAFSMFDGIAPGADSALTSVTTLLATLELLYRNPEIRDELDKSKRRLLFALFDGEAWDYIGSSDTVHKLLNNNFPLSAAHNESNKLDMKHLSHLIELNQLSAYQSPMDLFLHRAQPSTVTNGLYKLIEEEGAQLPLAIRRTDDKTPMPPGSSHSFLKHTGERERELFGAVLVSNHEREYTNKFYNSFRDDSRNDSSAQASRLADIATLMARTLYRLATDKSLTSKSFRANETLISEMLDCFFQNSNCPLFRSLQSSPTSITTPIPAFPTYVSVYGVRKPLREFTHRLMIKFSGSPPPTPVNTSQACQDSSPNCHWFGTECVCSSAYYLHTVSPAIDPQTYEIKSEHIANYALWTESKWQSSVVRVFMHSSPSYRLTVLIVGVVAVVLSLIANHLFLRHFCDLFCLHPDQSDSVLSD